MTGFVQTLHKDWRSNWLFWVAAAGANAIFGVEVVSRSMRMVAQRLDTTGLMLGLAELVPLAIAVASLIQADGPAMRLADWRSRPLEPLQVFLAKLVSILLFLLAPRFPIGILGGLLLQLPLADAMTASWLHLLTETIVLTLLIALASATQDFGQMALGVGVVFIATVLFTAARLIWDVDAALVALVIVALGCAGLTLALYLSGASYARRIAVIIACCAWLPLTTLLARAKPNAPEVPERDNELTRSISISLASYQDETEFVWSEDLQGKGAYLAYTVHAPEWVAIRSEGGDLTPPGKAPIALPLPADKARHDEFARASRVADFAPWTLHLQALPDQVAGANPRASQISLSFTAIVRDEQLHPLPSDGRFHRIGAHLSCRRLPQIVTCVAASAPPCIVSDRVDPSFRDKFRLMESCPSAGWSRNFRWPLPYAFASILYPNNLKGLSLWKETSRFERRFDLTQIEFNRARVDASRVEMALSRPRRVK